MVHQGPNILAWANLLLAQPALAFAKGAHARLWALHHARPTHIPCPPWPERRSLVAAPIRSPPLGCHNEPRSLADMERLHIEATLNATDWNKSRTSSILGIERSTLDRKIKRYELKQ